MKTHNKKVVKIILNTNPILEFLSGLESRLIDIPFEVFKRFPELVCFEQGGTTGASVTVLLKPSDLFLDLVIAKGTLDSQDMIVEECGHISSRVKE